VQGSAIHCDHFFQGIQKPLPPDYADETFGRKGECAVEQRLGSVRPAGLVLTGGDDAALAHASPLTEEKGPRKRPGPKLVRLFSAAENVYVELAAAVTSLPIEETPQSNSHELGSQSASSSACHYALCHRLAAQREILDVVSTCLTACGITAC